MNESEFEIHLVLAKRIETGFCMKCLTSFGRKTFFLKDKTTGGIVNYCHGAEEPLLCEKCR